MANKKITELGALASPTGADILAIVDDADTTTKKVTVSNLMGQAPVQSVAGRTGVVTIANTDVSGLGTAATSASTDFSPAFYSVVPESTTSRTLSNSDNRKVIVCSNSAQITVTLPSGLTSGFGCTVVQSGTGTVLIEGSGGTIVYGFGNKTATAGQYASINIYNAGTDTYALEGDTQAPPFVNTYSLDLNGTNQYLSFASTISTQVYAMSVWFKPDATITTGSNIMSLLSDSGTNHLILGGNVSGGLSNELISVFPTGAWYYQIAGGSIAANQYHHILFSWVTNSSTNPGNPGYDIWLNGSLVGNAKGGTLPTFPFSLSSSFEIGRKGTGSYFNGKIEEIAFWDSDVSADVSTIYNSGTPDDLNKSSVVSTAPARWYRMGDNNGGEGSTVSDVGTNSGAVNLTLNNSPAFSTDVP